jgi:D-alanine transaminase
MSQSDTIVWLNGRFLPLAEASISPLDRGFLFADAVYEVIPVYAKRPFLFNEHISRLTRSLRAIRMNMPMPIDGWANIISALIEKNKIDDGMIYLQVSRGADVIRNHAVNFALSPTIFLMASALAPLDSATLQTGVSALTLADHRWARCDIKSTSLLPNILAKSAAASEQAFEAILLADGLLREGSSSSVLIARSGTLFAPPYGPEILPGTTRDLCLRLANELDIPVTIAPITEHMLRQADEIMLCFATRGVLPVTQLDGKPIGAGTSGPLWHRLYAALVAYRQRVATEPFNT